MKSHRAGLATARDDLLSGRHQRRLDGSNRFRHFMSAEGGEPPLAGDATIDDYQAFFFESDNQVALQTIRSGTAAREEGGFYGD